MITTKGWRLSEKETKGQRITEKGPEETLDACASPLPHHLESVLEMEASSHAEMMMLTKEIPLTKISLLRKSISIYTSKTKHVDNIIALGSNLIKTQIRNYQDESDTLILLLKDFIFHFITYVI